MLVKSNDAHTPAFPIFINSLLWISAPNVAAIRHSCFPFSFFSPFICLPHWMSNINMASVASWKKLPPTTQPKTNESNFHPWKNVCPESQNLYLSFCSEQGTNIGTPFSLCTQVFVFMIAPESTAPGVTHRFPFFLENVCGCGSLLGYKNPLNYIICRTKKLSQFRFFHFPEKPMWICGKFLHDSYELQARFHRPRLHLNQGHKCIQMYTNIAGKPPKHGAHFHRIHRIGIFT